MAMEHIVSIGGGLTSTVFLPELMIERYGKEHVHLVMAKLPNEDPDVWRLCEAVEKAYGVSIAYIGLDKTPWDIFFQVRYLGNTRIDPCSRVLKREVLRDYLLHHFTPADASLSVGITWDESHRMNDIRARWGEIGYRVEAPLIEDFFLTRQEQVAECKRRFGFVPRLYLWNFSHNNCGGACVKAGKRDWARLLWYLPEVYMWWEVNEITFGEQVGPYTILRDERKDETHPLSLKAFRERCEEWWANCLPGTPFELLPRVKELTGTPACIACEAA